MKLLIFVSSKHVTVYLLLVCLLDFSLSTLWFHSHQIIPCMAINVFEARQYIWHMELFYFVDAFFNIDYCCTFSTIDLLRQYFISKANTLLDT